MALENKPSQLNAVCAFGLFAKGNETVDFDEIESDLKLLSKQSEQHMLGEWDFGNNTTYTIGDCKK